MTKNIRNLALATMSGFRHKTVDVPEWEGATVVLREPSAEAWLRWQEIVKAKDDETPLSVAERARRNLEADVELFIDVLCDTGLQPVFSEDDREQVIAVYGPVHARLLRQSLELISDAGEVKKVALPGMRFLMMLALRMGRTLSELRREMSASEIMMWAEFDRFSPLGDERADIRLPRLFQLFTVRRGSKCH